MSGVQPTPFANARIGRDAHALRLVTPRKHRRGCLGSRQCLLSRRGAEVSRVPKVFDLVFDPALLPTPALHGSFDDQSCASAASGSS